MEASVIYSDAGVVRRIRGEIIAEDEFFVTVRRGDGVYRLAKRVIERIEQMTGAESIDA